MQQRIMSTSTDELPCIGVVLAGGQSRRMGRDKALLPWQGRPLIERQLAILLEAGVDRAVASGHRPDYDGIDDFRSQAGPLSGLAGVAAGMPDAAMLLVIPVDMPLLGVGLMRRLRTEQPEACCLRFADRFLPMRLHLDDDSRRTLGILLDADDPRQCSLHALERSLDVQQIPLAPAEATQLTDCNTPAAWNEVIQ